MMKRKIAALFTATLIFTQSISILNVFAYASATSIEVDGSAGAPQIDINNRLLLPASKCLETFNYEAVEDFENKTVTITANNISLVFYANKAQYTVSGLIKTMDTDTIIYDENGVKTFMIPLRYICDELGYKIEWDAETRTALVSVVGSVSTSEEEPSAIEINQKHVFNDKLMAAVEEEGNFVISSFSVKTALAMLANGSGDEAKKQITDALAVSNLNDFNEDVKKLINSTSEEAALNSSYLEEYLNYEDMFSDEENSKKDVSEISSENMPLFDVVLNISNSIWVNKDQLENSGDITNENAFSSGFISIMKDKYDAASAVTDDKNAVKDINKWVYESTNGKIEQLLTEDSNKFIFALCNAVYFKATWENEFLPENNFKDDFIQKNGTKAETEYMNKTVADNYYENDDFQILRLQYKNYSSPLNSYMYFLLPRESFKGEISIGEALATADFNNFLGEGFRPETDFSMPKFDIDFTMGNVIPALQKMGVTDVFDSNKLAISKLSSNPELPLFVDNIIHMAKISVDENGTEAAAATAMFVAGAGMPPETVYYEMTLNRPFTFFVTYGDEILFSGEYNLVPQ